MRAYRPLLLASVFDILWSKCDGNVQTYVDALVACDVQGDEWRATGIRGLHKWTEPFLWQEIAYKRVPCNMLSLFPRWSWDLTRVDGFPLTVTIRDATILEECLEYGFNPFKMYSLTMVEQPVPCTTPCGPYTPCLYLLLDHGAPLPSTSFILPDDRMMIHYQSAQKRRQYVRKIYCLLLNGLRQFFGNYDMPNLICQIVWKSASKPQLWKVGLE